MLKKMKGLFFSIQYGINKTELNHIKRVEKKGGGPMEGEPD